MRSQVRPFSLRHKPEIASGRILVTITMLLRKRLHFALKNLDHQLHLQRDPNDNWVTNTSVFLESARELSVYHADEELDELLAGKDGSVAAVGRHLDAGDQNRILDFIEIFLQHHEQPATVIEQVNATMREEGCRWKLVDNLFVELLPVISEEIRQAIIDGVRALDVAWWGSLHETDFVARLVDVDTLPSQDSRYPNFRSDIIQHRQNNNDWPNDWILTDERVDLLRCDERRFIKFIECLLNPSIQPDAQAIVRLSDRISRSLLRCGYRLDKSDVRVGISQYTVRHGASDSVMGEGAFGQVRKTVLDGKSVAVKTLLHEWRRNSDAVQRFQYEISCLKRLRHLPGVIGLVAESVEGDTFCYAMECADGSLEEHLQRLPHLSDAQRFTLVDQVLAAVADIHEADVIHRDICPRNILVLGPVIKISDFGLALDRQNQHGLTRTSMRAGKEGYAAPELDDGFRNATHLSDIYALGKILQLIVTGLDPRAEPSGVFASVIRKATDFSQQRRYQSVRDMLVVVRNIVASTTAVRTMDTLAAYAIHLSTVDDFDPALFNRLITETHVSDVYHDFWDPLTTIMSGKRVKRYADWSLDGERILDYIRICAAQYENLPSVGWPYNMIGSMCDAAFYPVAASGHERALMLALDLVWPIGMTSDRWVVRDMIVQHLVRTSRSMSQAMVGHVITLIASHEVRTNIRAHDMEQFPQAISAAFKIKLNKNKEDA